MVNDFSHSLGACQCRRLSEPRLKSHRATCWPACVITAKIPCCSKFCLALLCYFSSNWKPENLAPNDLHFSQGPSLFFHLYDMRLSSAAFSFDQMERPFPLMWSSSQQTWWLGTQGVTMLASTSAGSTSPGPESLSLLLLSCMCLVGVMYIMTDYAFLRAVLLRLVPVTSFPLNHQVIEGLVVMSKAELFNWVLKVITIFAHTLDYT